jgi:hypothetical protein
MTIIKREIIPQFKIDKTEFYWLDSKTTDGWKESDFDLAENTYKKFKAMAKTVTKRDLGIHRFLMAVGVESVLKGLLLYNGFMIHEHKKTNKLTKIKTYKGDYSEFKNEIYTLSEFLKFHVLESTLSWESKKKRILILRELTHLKKLRDIEAHLAPRMVIFQIYDMLLFKRVDEFMIKSLEIIKRIP